MDILGGHLSCTWTYWGSSGVSMDIQGGHLGCPRTYKGVIWGVHAHIGWSFGSSGVSMDIRGGSSEMSIDIQGGHLGCPRTYRGVYRGVNGQGPKAPAMARRAHSLPQELGISARSALYF